MGAAASIILGVVGTAVSAVGSFAQASAASENAAYQAQVAANNAKVAQQNSVWEMQAGEKAASDKAMKDKAVAGEIAAGFAAHGIDVNSGSAADVQESHHILSEEGQETIKSNASKNAWGYRVQESNFKAQSILDNQEADQYASAAGIGAFSSLISGAGGVAKDWANLQTTGSTGGSGGW